MQVARTNDLITTAISSATSLVTSMMNTVAASKMREDQEMYEAEMAERRAELGQSQAELDAIQGDINAMAAQQRLVILGTAAAGLAVAGIGGVVLLRSRRRKKKNKQTERAA